VLLVDGLRDRLRLTRAAHDALGICQLFWAHPLNALSSGRVGVHDMVGHSAIGRVAQCAPSDAPLRSANTPLQRSKSSASAAANASA
jgi:hypothetical protein